MNVQEAQLSQTDRVTLCDVIQYFAKSLEVIRNDTDAQGACKSHSQVLVYLATARSPAILI